MDEERAEPVPRHTVRGRFYENGPYSFCDHADLHPQPCMCAAPQFHRGGEELQRRGTEMLAGRNFGYPEDYRDPPFDGTTAGFRDVVLPARVKALEQSLNETFADLLPEGCRFEWS